MTYQERRAIARLERKGVPIDVAVMVIQAARREPQEVATPTGCIRVTYSPRRGFSIR